MAENKVWTAEELLALSPDERDQVIRDSVVTDADKIPTVVTERARLNADARIAATKNDHRAR